MSETDPFHQRGAGGKSAVAPVTLSVQAERTAHLFADRIMSLRLFVSLYRLLEFTVLLALGMALYVLYVGHSANFLPRYLFLSSLAAVAAVICIEMTGGYGLAQLRARLRQTSSLAVSMLLAAALVTLVLFFLRDQDTFSRVWLALWVAIGFTSLFSMRALLGWKLRSWGRDGTLERRAVLVGGGTPAEKLIRQLEMQRESDVRICGIFDDRDDRRSPPLVAGYPKLGSVKELIEFARIARIDMLIVTLPLSAEQRIQTLLRDLWVLPLDIRIAAQSSDLRFRPRSYSYVGSVPFIDLLDRPIADWDSIVKRGFDLLFGTLALIALSPLMLVTAAAVRLDTPGPVFFRQKRHGFNNEIINVWKFRSLRHEAADPEGRRIVTRADDRVTRVGRFIRRTSIDELPQLFNVLAGELSLVGPRPHAVYARSSSDEAFVEIVDGYFGRHRVKPGITGWAQVKGWRGEIDQADKLKARFAHDLHYIENWSIFLDLWILILTPISILRTKGAY